MWSKAANSPSDRRYRNDKIDAKSPGLVPVETATVGPSDTGILRHREGGKLPGAILMMTTGYVAEQTVRLRKRQNKNSLPGK